MWIFKQIPDFCSELCLLACMSLTLLTLPLWMPDPGLWVSGVCSRERWVLPVLSYPACQPGGVTNQQIQAAIHQRVGHCVKTCAQRLQQGGRLHQSKVYYGLLLTLGDSLECAVVCLAAERKMLFHNCSKRKKGSYIQQINY